MPDIQSSPPGDKLHILDLTTCPKCGHSNAAGERYCAVCGAGLRDVAATTIGQAEQAKKRGILGRLLSRR